MRGGVHTDTPYEETRRLLFDDLIRGGKIKREKAKTTRKKKGEKNDTLGVHGNAKKEKRKNGTLVKLARLDKTQSN